MFTDHPSAFEDPQDPSTRATHFMKEAIKLWTIEEGTPSLTSLQAFPLLVGRWVIQYH